MLRLFKRRPAPKLAALLLIIVIGFLLRPDIVDALPAISQAAILSLLFSSTWCIIFGIASFWDWYIAAVYIFFWLYQIRYGLLNLEYIIKVAEVGVLITFISLISRTRLRQLLFLASESGTYSASRSNESSFKIRYIALYFVVAWTFAAGLLFLFWPLVAPPFLALMILLSPLFFAGMQVQLLRQFLFLASEGSAYSASRSAASSSEIRLIALPYLLVIWAFAACLGLAFAPQVNLEDQLMINFVGNMILVPPLFFAGIRVHLKPNHSRQLKYLLIMAPIPMLSILLVPKIVFGAADQDLLVLMSAFWYLIAIFIIAVSGGLWLRHVRTRSDQLPGSLSMLLFAFVRWRYAGLLLVLCLFASKPTLLTLLALRYVVIERFREQPVVYLRKFSQTETGGIFTNAIVPAIGSYGVLSGLVHRRQKASELLSRVSIWQFGLMATVPDEHWQDWVTRTLRKASLVIVDGTAMTESVGWELRTAMESVPVERLLLITRDPDAAGRISGPVVLFVEDCMSQADLRTRITRWVRDALPGCRRWHPLAAAVLWAAVMALAADDLWHTVAFLISLPARVP